MKQECGDTTNCLMYDTVKLRQALMLTTGFIMLVGVICDIGEPLSIEQAL